MFLLGNCSDVDQAVRSDLAASLRYVTAAAEAVLRNSTVELEDVCRQIDAHRVEPTLFARYYELVLALKAGRVDEALVLHHEISEQARRTPSFRTVPFGTAATAAEAERYQRWLSPKREGLPLIDAPDPKPWASFEANVEAAFDLLDRADPALGAEVRSLVVEVIGVSRHRGASGSFGGASTFMLWGSVFADVGAHPTRIDIAGRLVHEGAHQLLFGLSCREPLVTNALSERYPSPLRKEPRPVIGIYHATFVCARMYHAFTGMLRSNLVITNEERRILEDGRQYHRASFDKGLNTLHQDGKLTSLGRQLLDEAAAAFDSA